MPDKTEEPRMAAFGAWADVLIELRQSQAAPQPPEQKRRRASKSEAPAPTASAKAGQQFLASITTLRTIIAKETDAFHNLRMRDDGLTRQLDIAADRSSVVGNGRSARILDTRGGRVAGDDSENCTPTVLASSADATAEETSKSDPA